jgi:hypothetical protein
MTGSLAEAAHVCLARHHEPPTDLEVESPEGTCSRALEWTPPDQRTARAYANSDDATRDGAYSVSLAAVEAELGFVTHARCETRTGADWYVGPQEHVDDLEGSFRLEVSGTDEGDRRIVLGRVRKKLRQAAAGRSDKPAMVSVIGFLTRLVVIERLEVGED